MEHIAEVKHVAEVIGGLEIALRTFRGLKPDQRYS